MIGNRFTRLLMWMSLAAAATYFFDPERGDKRRKELRKQVNQLRRKGEDMGKKAARLAD
jgi:gas vesicle protein